MGFSDDLCQQLASADVAVTHARRGIVWFRAVRAAFDERAFARRQHGAVVSVIETIDGRALAERLCGGTVWIASVACGIGGVGVGTQGRVERIVFHADAADVCAVRGVVQSPKSKVQSLLRTVAVAVRLRPVEQADAGDVAVRAVTAGLLAAKPFCSFDSQVSTLNHFASGIGKTAVPCVERGFFGGHVCGTEGRYPTFRPHLDGHSRRKCNGLLCALSAQNVLAGGSGDSLSVSGALVF